MMTKIEKTNSINEEDFMNNQEHILVTADIQYVKTKFSKIVNIIFIIIVALSLVVGLAVGTYTYHSDGGETVYGRSYPAHDDLYIGWFGLDFYEDSEGWEDMHYFGEKYTYWGSTEEMYIENIIIVAALYIILFCLPAVITAIFKHGCKITALTITESQVYGSYNNFLFKKNLKMPIEKVDNLTTISGIIDKLRSGVTLGVCSASGVIKLHFVQNADEVIAATISRIEEIKEKEKRKMATIQSVVSTSVSSVSEKLKELELMKEQDLISEDEYNKKREEILEKM